ncbi:hypothetical protein B1808_03455 [Pseudofulvimonas gallinarii]|nr:hypothetical protein B1808_03455 [Pseudofulvimonas gallinarii]
MTWPRWRLRKQVIRASMEPMATPRRSPLKSCLLAASLFAALPLHAAWPDPVDSPAEVMPRAQRSLMLDVAAIPGDRLVAVGERGHILLSDDAGTTWHQAAVPVRSTLTAVAGGNSAVIAAGHDGVILRSTDRGESWQRVREERFSADNHFSPSNGTPLLDVLFLDDDSVLAVGAYALALRSDDAGASWQPLEIDLAGKGGGDAEADDSGDGEDETDGLLFDAEDLAIDDEVDPHLNAIARVGDALVMVGERGSVFRSSDGGESWQRLQLSYGGSMFGILPLSGQSLLVYGLRGRAFQSDDAGDSWRELDTRVTANLFGGDVGDDGSVVLVGAEGVVLRRAAGGDAFTTGIYTNEDGETPIGSAVRLRPDGSLLLIGDRGITTWQAQP